MILSSSLLLLCLCLLDGINTQPTRLVSPSFTCWFANHSKVSETQYAAHVYLVFGYANDGVFRELTPSTVSGRNRIDPLTLPQIQVTSIHPGRHLFAFAIEMPAAIQNVSWTLANRTVSVTRADLTPLHLCITLFRGCPGDGIHNTSSLITDFCQFPLLCDTNYACVNHECTVRVAPVCPANTACDDITLSCLTSAPTSQPTRAPTSAQPSAPTTTTAQPTSAATTAQPTRAPTSTQPTRAPTAQPTGKLPPAPTQRPTRTPTPQPTTSAAPTPAIVAPNGAGIGARVALVSGAALAMIACVILGLSRQREQSRRRL